MTDYIERYWRDATPQDAIKEPPMVARFRYKDAEDWVIGKLIYWDRSREPWNSETWDRFERCQVYDAPDPGEGWRLVDPNTETLQEGDGLMVSSHRESGWVEIQVRPNSWSERDFYRRRIEQPKPEPRYEPFRWEDREQLRGRWITWKHEDGTTIETQINHLSEHRLEGLWFKSRNPKWLVENATFLDTGEPAGRKIQ